MDEFNDNFGLTFILFKYGPLVHVDDQANQTWVMDLVILWAILWAISYFFFKFLLEYSWFTMLC